MATTRQEPSHSSMHVCADCFEDAELRAFVEATAVVNKCDFCDTITESPSAAPLEAVAEHILEYLQIEYTDPANSGLMYVSAEGGYQGILWSTEELLVDKIELELPRDQTGRLLEALRRAIDRLPESPREWAERDPYGLPEEDRLQISWEAFAQFVMHERRFFFRKADLPREPYEDPERLSPDELLQQIAQHAIDLELIERMPVGTRIYRARRQGPGSAYATAKTLGPAPPKSATQNRTSPAGIPMLHGSEDLDTAVAEVHRGPGRYAVGEFLTTRNAWILDLHDVPGVPSYFSETQGWKRHPLIFMRAFAKDVSKPISYDDRVHMEYVPTQVLTEYFRTQVSFMDAKIEGISFTSSKTGRRNYTLFVTPEQTRANAAGGAAPPLVLFYRASMVRRRRLAIPQWIIRWTGELRKRIGGRWRS